MSPVLLIFAIFVGLMASGAGAAAEEYKTLGMDSKRNTQWILAFFFAMLAALLGYWAGYVAPR